MTTLNYTPRILNALNISVSNHLSHVWLRQCGPQTPIPTFKILTLALFYTCRLTSKEFLSFFCVFENSHKHKQNNSLLSSVSFTVVLETKPEKQPKRNIPFPRSYRSCTFHIKKFLPIVCQSRKTLKTLALLSFEIHNLAKKSSPLLRTPAKHLTTLQL